MNLPGIYLPRQRAIVNTMSEAIRLHYCYGATRAVCECSARWASCVRPHISVQSASMVTFERRVRVASNCFNW